MEACEPCRPYVQGDLIEADDRLHIVKSHIDAEVVAKYGSGAREG